MSNSHAPMPRHNCALYMDFDGVLNFDTSRAAYKKFEGGLGYLRHETVWVPEGMFHLRWSAELVRKLTALDADWVWLTTWQRYAKTELDPVLHVNSAYTLAWAFDARTYSHAPKLDALLRDVHANPRPFVWVDDIATDFFDPALLRVDVPYLLVKPNALYGMSHDDLDAVTAFVTKHA